MSRDQMQDAILKVYPGWYNKVKSMKDGQILAIYNRLLNQKKL